MQQYSWMRADLKKFAEGTPPQSLEMIMSRDNEITMFHIPWSDGEVTCYGSTAKTGPWDWEQRCLEHRHCSGILVMTLDGEPVMVQVNVNVDRPSKGRSRKSASTRRRRTTKPKFDAPRKLS